MRNASNRPLLTHFTDIEKRAFFAEIYAMGRSFVFFLIDSYLKKTNVFIMFDRSCRFMIFLKSQSPLQRIDEKRFSKCFDVRERETRRKTNLLFHKQRFTLSMRRKAFFTLSVFRFGELSSGEKIFVHSQKRLFCLVALPQCGATALLLTNRTEELSHFRSTSHFSKNNRHANQWLKSDIDLQRSILKIGFLRSFAEELCDFEKNCIWFKLKVVFLYNGREDLLKWSLYSKISLIWSL